MKCVDYTVVKLAHHQYSTLEVVGNVYKYLAGKPFQLVNTMEKLLGKQGGSWGGNGNY